MLARLVAGVASVVQVKAAAVLRRRWIAGGYYRLAMYLEDREMVEAVCELAPHKPEADGAWMEAPAEGLTCELRGG